MRCYLFNLFSKALFCIFGHANQSHIREWVAQKIITEFACIKCTIACRSWPLPSTYLFLYSPLRLRFSEKEILSISSHQKNWRAKKLNEFAKWQNLPKYQLGQTDQLFCLSVFLVRRNLRELREFLFQKIRALLLLYSSLIAPAWVSAQWKIISIIFCILIRRGHPWNSKVNHLFINRGLNSTTKLCYSVLFGSHKSWVRFRCAN